MKFCSKVTLIADTMGVSWAYKLNKQQLLEELAKHGITIEGRVVELKQILVGLIRKHPNLFPDAPNDADDYDEEKDRTLDQEKFSAELVKQVGIEGTVSTPLAVFMPDNQSSVAKTLDQMGKWNCHVDGKDLYAFLERENELRTAYAMSEEDLLHGFPELLRGDTQLWYRNALNSFHTWEELQQVMRGFSLPPGERRHLDRQISERRQLANESFRIFVTALATLMRRRGGIAAEDQLDNIYYNMKPELRLHISRESFHSVNELIQNVEAVEETWKQINKEKKSTHTQKANVMAVSDTYDRFKCC